MKKQLRISLIAALPLILSQCTAPPPGTVVFDGEGNPDDVVMEYHGISEDDLAGHKVIKIETQSIRNPQDTTAVYVPDYERAANFN